jgi:hypothetical protein
MDRLIDNKEDLNRKLDEYFKRVEAIQKLPEYQKFIEYKNTVDAFNEFVAKHKREKTAEFLESFIKDEEAVVKWLERIKKLEKRLSDSAWKRHESFCSSNIMDHIWEVAQEIGEEVDVEGMFGGAAYRVGQFTIEHYSGQGEYGYSVYINKRLF